MNDTDLLEQVHKNITIAQLHNLKRIRLHLFDLERGQSEIKKSTQQIEVFNFI